MRQCAATGQQPMATMQRAKAKARQLSVRSRLAGKALWSKQRSLRRGERPQWDVRHRTRQHRGRRQSRAQQGGGASLKSLKLERIPIPPTRPQSRLGCVIFLRFCRSPAGSPVYHVGSLGGRGTGAAPASRLAQLSIPISRQERKGDVKHSSRSSAWARADLGVEGGRLLRVEQDVRRGAPAPVRAPPYRVGSAPPVAGQHPGEHLERGGAR
jgi:hypothetical protein